MTKKTKATSRRFTKKSLAFWTLAVVVVATVTSLGVLAYIRIDRYNRAADAISAVSFSAIVLQAAEGTKSPAVIEPTTGNIYFPQARLYLPSTNNFTQLTYSYNPPDLDQQEELSISSKAIFSKNSIKLYAATSQQEVFNALPQLQACQRGITLSYNKSAPLIENTELKQTVSLNNGKTLYLYAEKTCSELTDLALLLANIKAY